ncbi:MAG: apolipoprotein N-acyltransferase [Frankiales bacterium]|nr:apolipoprotein N-acyltransferase [Frankiales bacterium]
MKARLVVPTVFAAVSGLLLNLAFPPHDLWWLAPVAVGLLTNTLRGRTLRQGALLGWVHGLVFFGVMLVWTGTIAGSLAWFALSLLESLFTLLLGIALTAVLRLPAWPLWAATVWVGEEALRDRLPFGGFPWGRLAFSQGHTPLTPLASWGGAPLVTLGVAALGALLVRSPGRAVLLGPTLVVLAVATPVPTGGQPLSVGVVQGNVPRVGLERDDQVSQVLANHVQATHQLAADVRAGRMPAPQVVIWPENASDLDPYTDPQARADIQAAVDDVGVPVLVGAVTDGPGRFVSNRGIVWNPVTGAGASYVKRHPVPFGEYIPYRSLIRKVTNKVDLVPNDFARGTRPGVLQLGPVRLADVICFEVAYDGVVRDAVRGGGRLLVVQTNNATFGRSGETSQQLAMSRLRAVELGRSVIIAATSGESAVIAPDGTLLHHTKLFTRDITVQRVPLRSGTTVASHLGAWPELVLALVALGAVFTGVRR